MHCEMQYMMNYLIMASHTVWKTHSPKDSVSKHLGRKARSHVYSVPRTSRRGRQWSTPYDSALWSWFCRDVSPMTCCKYGPHCTTAFVFFFFFFQSSNNFIQIGIISSSGHSDCHDDYSFVVLVNQPITTIHISTKHALGHKMTVSRH